MIPSFLYLGAVSAAQDKKFITKHKIKRIVSIGADPKIQHDGVVYHRFRIKDSIDSDITQLFDDVNRVLEEGRERKECVLVHCKAGISRSPTLVIAYLMKYLDTSLKDALHQVLAARPSASPNGRFMKELINYELALGRESSWEDDILPKKQMEKYERYRTFFLAEDEPNRSIAQKK